MPPRPVHIAVFFGGRSTEHAVSLASARNVLSVLAQLEQHLWPIAVDRGGDWYLVNPAEAFICDGAELLLNPAALHSPVTVAPRAGRAQLLGIGNGEVLCPQLDLFLPLIHGQDGEDGALQGLAQLCGLPCCGSSIAGAALSMDKELSKRVLQQLNLPVTPFYCLPRGTRPPEWQQLRAQLGGGDLFVKPCSQGSSVGVSRVRTQAEWLPALQHSWHYDHKLLVEQAMIGREIEFALLERAGRLEISGAGEIIVGDGGFYDYQHKYVSSEGVRLLLDCQLPVAQENAMKQAAIQAFYALGLSGFARADFFLLADGQFFINELNSLPGFTLSSMFPRLWQHAGLSLLEVVQAIISSAQKA